jgi:hypothetical protein
MAAKPAPPPKICGPSFGTGPWPQFPGMLGTVFGSCQAGGCCLDTQSPQLTLFPSSAPKTSITAREAAAELSLDLGLGTARKRDSFCNVRFAQRQAADPPQQGAVSVAGKCRNTCGGVLFSRRSLCWGWGLRGLYLEVGKKVASKSAVTVGYSCFGPGERLFRRQSPQSIYRSVQRS